MKLRVFSLFFLFMMTLSFSLSAKSIEPQQARNAAIAFYYERVAQNVQLDFKDVMILDEQLLSRDGIPMYYIFNFTRGGWVLLSADDRAIPVIGYAFEGIYDPKKNPCCLQWWMTQIEEQMKAIAKDDMPAVEGAVEQWAYLVSRTENNVNIFKEKDVEPLLLSNWDQGKYYNALCPPATGGPDDRALVGCVATSMCQVMFYYRWPLQGNGSHGGITFSNYYYRWNEMMNGLSNYNQGVAEICYHAGKAVDMSYGATGSGANTSDVDDALEDYFRYSTDAAYAQKFAYSTTNWNNMLRNNIDAGHPIVYSGTDPANGGHAWNLDGYQGTDYYHMNWGWSGYGNGYFYLNNLSVAGNTFSDWQGCVYNIYPPSASYPSYCSGTTNVNYSIGTFEDGSGPDNYENNANCSWLINPTEVIARLSISVNAINTESTNDVIIVYDGDNTGAPVLATWSGTTIPSSIQTTQDKALVVFTSNGSTTGTGWQLEYRSVYPVYCSGITNLTAPSGSIDDGSGANSYSYNHTCRWYIKPPDVQSITIDFTEFNVASDDWVNIYNGYNADLLNSYYGTSIPAQATYPIDNVLVYFKTNGSNNGNGWALNYSSIPLGVDEFGLPGLAVFPNPAIDRVNVSIAGESGENYQVQIYSLDGRCVLTHDIQNSAASFVEEINVGDIGSGAYILRLYSSQGVVNSKLLID